jgi:predicted metal-dependent hydrolase
MERKLSRDLTAQLNSDAERIAGHFELRYRCIEAERANVKRRYGVCYSDGTIRIRLRHAVSGRPLKYSSLVNTLCHELAHLKHFNHGLRFREFYRGLLEWARAEGIYRPRKSGPSRDPVVDLGRPATPPLRRDSGLAGEQLSLFG